MECSSLDKLALEIGQKPSYLRALRQEGLPGHQGHWDTAIIVPWMLAHVSGQKRKKAAASGVSDDSEDQLNRKRRIEADILQIKLDHERQKVVHLRKVKEFFFGIASRIRSLGETLEREHGPDALDRLNDAILDMETSYSNFVTVVDDSTNTDAMADTST